MASPPRHAADSPPPQPTPKRVLIVRPSALGDVARTVPALVTLKQAWPDAQIHWLVSAAFADAVRAHPDLSGVVRFDRKALRGFPLTKGSLGAGLALRKELASAGYDVVYDLQGLARSGLLTYLTGARRRVVDAGAREMGWLGGNVRHRLPSGLHTVDHMLALLEHDGHKAVRDMRLHTPPEGRDQAEPLGIAQSRTLVLAPTAAWGCKCWPAEKFAQLAAKLLSDQLVDRVIVTGSPSPSERQTVERVVQAVQALGFGQVVQAPTLSVAGLMAVIEQAAGVVANDSAALHLAVGLQTPVVGVFGPTDPSVVGPYRHGSVVQAQAAREPGFTFDYRKQRQDDRLIATVAVEAVEAAARPELASAS